MKTPGDKVEGSIRGVRRAFTLLELLVVISIIGLIAGLALPVMRNFKPNYSASFTRTLLDELARARQLAISQRTTVYMVFVPTNFWSQPAFARIASDPVFGPRAARLYDKQLIGYNFVSLRSLGDQPGRPSIRYLSSWRTLPEGAFIHPMKFALPLAFNSAAVPFIIPTNAPNGTLVPAFQDYGFDLTTRTNSIPFPSDDAPIWTLNQPYIRLPYIGWDYMGRLVSKRSAIIPIAKGHLAFARDPTSKQAAQAIPTIIESPPNNVTNAYTVISIDWLTGRARAIQQEVR